MLRTGILAFLFAVPGVAMAASACPITADQLNGSAWDLVSERGPIVEFALTTYHGKREFQSWLHFRPASFGTWQFDRCVLVITEDDGDSDKLVRRLRPLSFKQNILRVEYETLGGHRRTVTYRYSSFSND
ncbi:MAG TPA: hypothetical protein VF292_14920 [Rhodanobacteraceae bacterium]